MIKKTDRTVHSIQYPNKPISENYKIYSLAKRRYIYNFSQYSPINGHKDEKLPLPSLNSDQLDEFKALKFSNTSIIITRLTLSTYTNRIYVYSLFLDNFFTSLKLIKSLKIQDIYITSTSKTDIDLLNILLKVKTKQAKYLPKGTLIAVEKDGVLYLI